MAYTVYQLALHPDCQDKVIKVHVPGMTHGPFVIAGWGGLNLAVYDKLPGMARGATTLAPCSFTHFHICYIQATLTLWPFTSCFHGCRRCVQLGAVSQPLRIFPLLSPTSRHASARPCGHSPQPPNCSGKHIGTNLPFMHSAGNR